FSDFGISISDVDNEDVNSLTSYGFESTAPLSVTLKVLQGRLSLPIKDDLSIFVGRGMLDRIISFRGSITSINDSLLKLQYVCRSMDGCDSHYADKLSIMANDEGFYGKGGPMSTSTE